MSANTLFDSIKTMHFLKTDVQLGNLLEVSTVALSKMRHGAIPVGATLIVSIHEETGWATKKIKSILAEEKGFNGVDIDKVHLKIKELA